MTDTYVDMDGVENVSVGLIRQAKKDFIKGAKILYDVMKKIPTQNELKSSSGFRLVNDPDVRLMYDAWRFVRKDPYDMFDPGEETIINSWKDQAVIDYYKDFYITGAAILYYKKASKTKPIYELSNSTLKKYIKDKKKCEEFIMARDYICNLINGKDLIQSWTEQIRNRTRLYDRHIREGKMDANTFSLADGRVTHLEKRKKDHEEAIKKTKELFDAGTSIDAIAKELNIARGTALRYVREASKES